MKKWLHYRDTAGKYVFKELRNFSYEIQDIKKCYTYPEFLENEEIVNKYRKDEYYIDDPLYDPYQRYLKDNESEDKETDKMILTFHFHVIEDIDFILPQKSVDNFIKNFIHFMENDLSVFIISEKQIDLED